MKAGFKHMALRGLSAVEGGFDALHHKAFGGRNRRVQILCYAGFRNARRLRMSGRIVVGRRPEEQGAQRLSRLRTMLDLYDSDEVPGVALSIECCGETYRAESDGEGYFRIDAEIDRALPSRTCWETASVRATSAEAEQDAHELAVLAPGTNDPIGVISDIDDTVLETGATSLLSKGWNGLFMPPEDRMAVPGAAELFQMLAGEGEGPARPVFYVSSSSWNVYGYIARFMEMKGLPRGPMFLKDFGLGETQFFSGGHVGHKIEAIETILSCYPDFKFLLVGDNGQKDVETYHRIVREHRGRVAGVFIRDVGGGCRSGDARRLLEEVEQLGVEVYCGERMDQAGERAARLGFTTGTGGRAKASG